ncbi:MAG: hypothetical protein HFJ38_02880 [Bacilli bacterium]|nr:hypothetical protein [Bacilli bacterium]
MRYPKYTDYEKIYKRYFNKGVNYLIEKAQLKKDDKVLDICGGNGRLAKEIKKKCKDVSYVEQEINMIPKDLQKLGIKVYNEKIESFVKKTEKTYTKVFCEQGINYWLLNIDIEQFSNKVEKNGLFIFNTFSNKPSKKPMIKEYTKENIKYIEISYLIKNKVHHIQVRQDFKPHITEFDWIAKEKYIELLSPYFNIEIVENNKSALYICKRK